MSSSFCLLFYMIVSFSETAPYQSVIVPFCPILYAFSCTSYNIFFLSQLLLIHFVQSVCEGMRSRFFFFFSTIPSFSLTWGIILANIYHHSKILAFKNRSLCGYTFRSMKIWRVLMIVFKRNFHFTVLLADYVTLRP